MNDKKFGISKKGFGILEQMEYHRLEEKIRFLISKFIPTFDFSHEIVWAHFVEFKKFRDTIMHPRQDEDKIKIEEYDKRLKTGLSSIIKIMDQLCKGIFKKKLRKKIVELSL